MMMLSNEDLVVRIGELARNERHGMVDLIVHLAEMEGRGLHLELGHPSLFAYCTGILRFSKASAFRYSHAAELVVRFPRVAVMLREGSLCLEGLCVVRELVTEELLERIAHKTVEEVRALVGALQPQPAPPDRIQPVSCSVTELRFSVGPGFMAELEQVKSLLSHKLPGAGLEQVFQACMQATIKTAGRRKHARRAIPAAVRREVWERDEGRCTFEGADGPCGSMHQTEFHHIVGFAEGGRETATNMTVHCRAHNQHVG